MPPETSTTRVQDELRHAILDGQLAPGERLTAGALAARHGTSRTPVREALLLLEREGLVALEPHRGAVVRAFDAADVHDLYEVRALVEPHAAVRAATRIGPAPLARLREICCEAEAVPGAAPAAVATLIALNEELHGIVIQAAGSPRLEAALRAVAGVPRPFRAAFWRDPAQREQSLFCHRELVRALDARQPALAEAVMRMHILGAKEFLVEVTAR
jgi:DNA-binding GntR family transcriptional regulator